MAIGERIMSDWNLGDSPFSPHYRDSYTIEDEEINQFLRETQSNIPYEALLAYMQKRDMTWQELAPPPTFDPGRVHHWMTGKERPSPKSINRIKECHGISDDEVPTENNQTLLAAYAETLKLIRGRRRPTPGPPRRDMNLHLYKALEFTLGEHPKLLSMPDGKVRDKNLAGIAHRIHHKFPEAGIGDSEPKDLHGLLGDWAGPFLVLLGAQS